MGHRSSGTDFVPGAIVTLLAETRCGGHIHEIGSRARIVESGDDGLTLAFGDGTSTDAAAVPPTHVTLVSSRRVRLRRRGTVAQLRYSAA